MLTCFPDHLLDFLIRQLLTQVCHDMAQLSSVDEACMAVASVASIEIRRCCPGLTIAILVKDLEGLSDLLFGVGILHFASHHSQELGCGDIPLSV